MIRSHSLRVFVVGSSITIHFGPYLEKELEGRFGYDRKRDTSSERAEDNLDIPQGASGGDSGQVLAYLKKRRLSDPIPADILMLQCGLHDLRTDPASGSKRVEPGQFAVNLRACLEESEAMGLEVVWLRITPVVDNIHNKRSQAFHRFNADADTYNALADALMKEKGTKTIDLHRFCATQLPHALIDHIHYNKCARAAQTEFLRKELERIFPNGHLA